MQVDFRSKTERPLEDYREHPHDPFVYFVQFFSVFQHKAGLRAYCILDSVLGSKDTRVKKTVPSLKEHAV